MMRRTLPFLVSSIVWAIVGAALCIWKQPDVGHTIRWMLGLWLFSVLDLVALVLVVRALVQFMAAPAEDSKRGPYFVQMALWMSVKLVCLVSLGTVLWLGRTDMPDVALFTGLSTLIVVPLVGGGWWSYRELRNA